MNEREIKAEVFIPLTRGYVTVIDFEDFEKVRGRKAASAYDTFARKLHGEFACVNFPNTGERGAL